MKNESYASRMLLTFNTLSNLYLVSRISTLALGLYNINIHLFDTSAMDQHSMHDSRYKRFKKYDKSGALS